MGLFSLINKPFIKFLNREQAPRNISLSNFERLSHELKLCDIILVEGRSRVSDVIRWVTLSPWTHAALYIGRLHEIEDLELRAIVSHYSGANPDDQLIVESLLGRGTIVRSLDCYQRDHLRISRPRGLTPEDGQRVIRHAISQLGYDYDVRHILDLARFMFPWLILPRRWRSSLFRRAPGHSTRTVCSTMIAESFAFVQFPILPLIKRTDDEAVKMYRRNPMLYTPSDFDYSPYFDIIKYPFLDFNYHASYRLMPWSGRVELGDGGEESYMEEADITTEQQVAQDLERTAIALGIRKGLPGDSGSVPHSS